MLMSIKMKFLIPFFSIVLFTLGNVQAQSLETSPQCNKLQLCNKSGVASKAILVCSDESNREVALEPGECKSVKICRAEAITWCPAWNEFDCRLPECVRLTSCDDSKSFKCESDHTTTYFNFNVDCQNCTSTFTAYNLY